MDNLYSIPRFLTRSCSRAVEFFMSPEVKTVGISAINKYNIQHALKQHTTLSAEDVELVWASMNHGTYSYKNIDGVFFFHPGGANAEKQLEAGYGYLLLEVEKDIPSQNPYYTDIRVDSSVGLRVL